ncbi:MAG TPA: alpha/beta hydrolase [Thermoanaerobaculia bacterium]|nr:alpha/beta hydrolase [Thermoanaerobaculia bacterium]
MRRVLVLSFLLTLPLSAATFESHDGTKLFYEVIGKGEPILMLSGGPGFSPDYLRPVAEKLSEKHAFVLFHQRGTGKSPVDRYDAEALSIPKLVSDLEALRKELKVEQWTIVGHSFGGILSMMYAREHPQRIRALALVDSGGPTLASVLKFQTNLESRFTDEERAQIKEWSAPEKMKANRRLASLQLTKIKTAAYFADRAKAHLFTDKMTDDWFHEGVFWSIVPQMMALDLRAGLENVKAPVLVIHGKQDPLETADEVHKTFPDSKLVVLENAGHFPWLEQEGAFYKALGEFLTALR